MYGLMWLCKLQEKLDDIEILTLLVSAICHDLDHPGYNNSYQVLLLYLVLHLMLQLLNESYVTGIYEPGISARIYLIYRNLRKINDR